MAVRVPGFRTRSSYLLRAVSIILENGGEKFQFLVKGIVVTESFVSVYQASKD
jgi:hypothetical protein